MIIYTESNSSRDATWEMDCQTFTYKAGPYTFVAPLTGTGSLDGSLFYDADPDTPAYAAVMKFIGPGNEALPRVRRGHWKFTFTYDGKDISAGAKLNSDGTVEASPAGETSLGPDTFWQVSRGEVSVGNNIILFRGLALSANLIEGSYYVDLPGQSEYGFFSARYAPGIVDDDAPEDQAPLG